MYKYIHNQGACQDNFEWKWLRFLHGGLILQLHGHCLVRPMQLTMQISDLTCRGTECGQANEKGLKNPAGIVYWLYASSACLLKEQSRTSTAVRNCGCPTGILELCAGYDLGKKGKYCEDFWSKRITVYQRDKENTQFFLMIRRRMSITSRSRYP